MKKVLYVIGALLLLYLVLAFIGPKQVKVEREVSISKPAETVKTKLLDFKFFNEQWNPWMELDTAMKLSYKGNPGETGHYYDWEGNSKVRSGSMEIVAISKDSITINLAFGKGGDVSKTYYILSEANGATQVKWHMLMEVGFFGRPIMLFMNMEKMIGERFEKGLAKLKTAIESMKEEASASFEIKEVDWTEHLYAGKRQVVSTANGMQELSDFFKSVYSELFANIGMQKIEVVGAPSAIYYKWEEKQTDVAAVVPILKETKIKGYEFMRVEAGKAVMITYTGPDEGSMLAHNAIGAYLKEKGLEQKVVVEEYLTDREAEKDPTKWQTNIYYILK